MWGGGWMGWGYHNFGNHVCRCVDIFSAIRFGGGGGYTLVLKKNLFEKKIYKVPEYDVIC